MQVVWKAWAFFKRDLLTDLSYKFSFALQSLHAMRAALLDGAATAEILPQIGALGLFTVIALPLSLVAFNAGLRRARVTGTLGHL